MKLYNLAILGVGFLFWATFQPSLRAASDLVPETDRSYAEPTVTGSTISNETIEEESTPSESEPYSAIES
jgi:hypothetical protein